MARRILVLAVAAAALGAGGCAYDAYGPGPYGDYAYGGSEWGGPRRGFEGPLRGPGLTVLDPWLAETREGHEIVRTGFRDAGHGFLDEETAHRINIWFRFYADTDRDRRLTDEEIRIALVQASRGGAPGPY